MTKTIAPTFVRYLPQCSGCELKYLFFPMLNGKLWIRCSNSKAHWKMRRKFLEELFGKWPVERRKYHGELKPQPKGELFKP